MLQFKIDEDKCVQCGECAADCPYMVIAMDEGGLPTIAPERADQCIGCQHCLAVCPTGALSILGKDPDDSLPLDVLPDADALERLVMGRRSTRRYKDEPLAPELIERLIQGAAHAPTGVNDRGVLFTVVEDPSVLARLREKTMEGLRGLMDSGKLTERLAFFGGFVEIWEDKGVDVLFRKAPHLLVTSAPEDAPCPEADCFIAMTSFELLASSRGLGTLWDGLLVWAWTQLLPEIPALLGIPENHKLGYVMLFGTPAVKYHRTVQRADAPLNRVATLK